VKTFGWIVGGLLTFVIVVIVLGALGLGVRWVNMQVEAWFAPREQNIKREVFENTKSYNEGKEQELIKYKFEYDRAKAKKDQGTMTAIEFAVRQAFADYEDDRLSPELRDFVRHCKYGG